MFTEFLDLSTLWNVTFQNEILNLIQIKIIWLFLRYNNGEGNGTPLQYSCLENPWTEEPGGGQSMGSLRVGDDWTTSLSLFTFMHWRRKLQPTPVFLPGESQGRGSLVGCRLGGCTESDTTEVTQQQKQQQGTINKTALHIKWQVSVWTHFHFFQINF